MSIPSNISRDHLLKAIHKIDQEGIPTGAHSSTYDLIFRNRQYPPKLVVSYANQFANGSLLERNSFAGGLGTPAFKLLEEQGFEIAPKEGEGFYDQLQEFLKQADTDNLKTKHFKRNYRDLKVKVSFGAGNRAKVPWISFLSDPNTTSNGIYPVYLYYTDIKQLVLAYGVSTTNKPPYFWNLEKEQSIASYFQKHFKQKPERYGNSFIFKVYDVENLPDSVSMNRDLNQIIAEYKELVEAHASGKDLDFEEKTLVEEPNHGFKKIQEFDGSEFFSDLTDSGLIYSPVLVTRFVAALLTKPFVILTGLSGSGKTKLAQAFTQWISEREDQYCLVPVGADWTNREPLLGYPNALDPTEYIKPDNGVLDLLLRARENDELPYFLILDEMNLSHVERYFADFLSVMESKDKIPLYAEHTTKKAVQDGSEPEEIIPSSLVLPPNLFIIGTVNIDETTNMFSPKVLDRANTIEFRVSSEEMAKFLNHIREITMSRLQGKGASMAADFLLKSNNKDFPDQELSEVNNILIGFFDQLSRTGAEFGYRSATEILRLIQQLGLLDPALSMDDKVDIAIMQKLLPKLHGSRRKLTPVLSMLASFCFTSDITSVEKDVLNNSDFPIANNPEVRFKLTLAKIKRMYQGAVSNGFASFAEA